MEITHNLLVVELVVHNVEWGLSICKSIKRRTVLCTTCLWSFFVIWLGSDDTQTPVAMPVRIHKSGQAEMAMGYCYIVYMGILVRVLIPVNLASWHTGRHAKILGEPKPRPQCRRTWTVQSYSPGGSNVHTIHIKPKMVAMTTSIRTSILAMSLWDSFTTKTQPKNQTLAITQLKS